ncbi:MAG: hypothetical protein ABFS86_07315 [Planctomycetota bacterium]
MNRTAFLTLVLLLAACGKMPGTEDAGLPATDAQTADAVLTGILERLGTEYEEHGPEFVRRVPVVKQEVVVAHGFEDWRKFSEQVRLLDPNRDLWISRQITRRIEELLQTPPPPEEEPGAGENEETE